MRGSASRSVTSVPNVRKIDANSTPTAPHPTTTMDLGIACIARISRFVRITLPSISTPGSDRASDPVASIVYFVSSLGRLAIFLHRNAARPRDSSPAGDRFHLVLLEERSDPQRVLLYDLVLAREHRRPVDFHVLHFEAELLGSLEVVVDIRVVQENFRRDAAHVQAGAAEKRILLHDRRLQPPLRRANRRDVAAGAAPDDHQIIFGQTNPPLRFLFPPGPQCDAMRLQAKNVTL